MNRETAIKTAAKWWTDKLRQRAPHDNGDKSRESQIAMMLADLLATPMSDKQLNRFQKALEENIDRALNKYTLGLHCDYGPDHLLFDAARQAKIDSNNFPYKTSMFIEEKGADIFTVKVSDGYAQPYENVNPCE